LIFPNRTAILIGLALALSSTAFVLQLLAEQKMLKSSYGRASLAVLLLQDLAVVPLLALVPLLAAQEFTIGVDIAFALLKAAAILALVVVFGRFLLHPILHRVAHARSQESFTALVVVLVLGGALLTEHIGLSMAMGAFIAGLLIADSPYRHGVVAEIHPFRGLLLGLFFMSMGMSIDLATFLAQPFAMLRSACLAHRRQIRRVVATGQVFRSQHQDRRSGGVTARAERRIRPDSFCVYASVESHRHRFVPATAPGRRTQHAGDPGYQSVGAAPGDDVSAASAVRCY
jgi:Kef-type K+ transport system membrane component KefB